MRRVGLLLPLLALAVAAGASVERDVADDPLVELPAELVERLYEKRLLVLQEVRARGPLSGGMLLAFVIFEQPRARVLELLGQTWRQAEFRPELRSIETVARHPDGTTDEHRLRILFVEVVYRLRYHTDREAARIAWALDPAFDNDLARVDGFWDLYELEASRTLGRFGTAIDVGPVLPPFLQDMATRRNLPRTLERCRRWVDADGAGS
jgi:hypothetical protein